MLLWVLSKKVTQSEEILIGFSLLRRDPFIHSIRASICKDTKARVSVLHVMEVALGHNVKSQGSSASRWQGFR